MARSKIGLHIAANCAGCGGIELFWQKMDEAGIPFVVYAVNDAGLIAKAAQYQHATLVYRDVGPSTLNPSAYASDPDVIAELYWQNYLTRLPQEIVALKSRVWIELLNEPGKEENQANWVGWFMYHAAQTHASGWKVCGPGWSPGTPEPEHWHEPGWRAYLGLCQQYPNRVAVSLHEYSLDNDIHFAEGYLIDRLGFLVDACEAQKIAIPRIFVTECGWTYNSMPDDEQAKKDIAYLAELYARYPTVETAQLWTLQGGAGNGNLPQRLNVLTPWLLNYNITALFPDPDPVIPPPPTGDSMLKNGSFELPWTDDPNYPIQQPAHWKVTYNTGPGYPNKFPEGQPYKPGEAVHKRKQDLPLHEQSVFIWDGNVCYKVFGGGDKSFWASLAQELELAAGKYLLSTPLWVDHYKTLPGGGKDYKVDADQAQMRVLANGKEVRPWLSLPAGTKPTVLTEIEHGGGPLKLVVELRSNWDINGNFFIDGWTLEPVGAIPQPGKHMAVVVKLPQGATVAEWQYVTAYAVQYQHTITASHDDMLTILRGGNADSYVKLCWPERQNDVVAMLAEAGYRWEGLFKGVVVPPFPA